jgi:hypothetical protein
VGKYLNKIVIEIGKYKLGKGGGVSFFVCLYNSAINICIISYLLTKKEKKGKKKGKKEIFVFLFVCMILLGNLC